MIAATMACLWVLGVLAMRYALTRSSSRDKAAAEQARRSR